MQKTFCPPCQNNQNHQYLWGISKYLKSDNLPNNFFPRLVEDTPLAYLIDEHSQPYEYVKVILTYIEGGGAFENPKIRIDNEIDCSRFFFKVLDVLSKLTDHNKIKEIESDFWQQYSQIAKKVYERLDKHQDIITKKGWNKFNKEQFVKDILTPLTNRFKEAPHWRVKASVVKGITQLVKSIPISHQQTFFWYSIQTIVNHYKAVFLNFKGEEVPEHVRDGVLHLATLYCQIALQYKYEVVKNIIPVSHDLWALIPESGNVDACLSQLSLMLKSFEFEVVTSLSYQFPPKRSRWVQKEFSILAGEIHNYFLKNKDKMDKDTIRKFEVILPYLHGYDLRDRKKPKYKECTLEFKGGEKKKPIPPINGILNNICGRSFRAYDVTIEGASLEKEVQKDSTKPLKERVQNEIPIRLINTQQKFFAKDFKLMMKYDSPLNPKPVTIKMPSLVLRGKNISQNCCRIVLCTPDEIKKKISPLWIKYVKGLEPCHDIAPLI